MTAWAYRLELFGGFTVWRGLEPLVLSPTAQQVVAVVALSSRPLTRSRVVTMLWPDDREAVGRARLRAVLWRLQREGHPLLTADDRVRLAREVFCDVVRAREASHRLIARCETDDDLTFDIEGLGELLPHWDYEWVLVERERERQRLLHTLETRARVLLAHGRIAEATDTALSAVALDPLRETARRVLIDIHLAAGNMVDAVREFRSFAARLDQEFGVGPSEALSKRLREHIRQPVLTT
jgi:DNA-binding SARP family transcriptional activator